MVLLPSSMQSKNIDKSEESKLWLNTLAKSRKQQPMARVELFPQPASSERELQLKLCCGVNVPLRLGVTAPTGGCVLMNVCVCVCVNSVYGFGHRHEVSLAGIGTTWATYIIRVSSTLTYYLECCAGLGQRKGELVCRSWWVSVFTFATAARILWVLGWSLLQWLLNRLSMPSIPTQRSRSDFPDACYNQRSNQSTSNRYYYEQVQRTLSIVVPPHSLSLPDLGWLDFQDVTCRREGF